MLEFLVNRLNDYSVNNFVNELSTASKNLGVLEAKIDSYQFNGILIPLLQIKEARSSMYIEGTQTTVTEILQRELKPQSQEDKIQLEANNHIQVLIYGAEHLRTEKFTHSFMKKIHEIMMNGIIAPELKTTLGKYKTKENRIMNSAGTVVYNPPLPSETKKYMDELISFMNNIDDGLNPLIKAAIIHSQFESIHPYSDGNGRVGRVLVSLYMYKAKVINFPFFYISEAISVDKSIYYKMLTDSRLNSYDEWIRYFLNKIALQTTKHISYIDALNALYRRTKKEIKRCINSPKFDEIIECLFTQPILNANILEDKLTISHGQAVRYLNTLEEKKFYFPMTENEVKLFSLPNCLIWQARHKA